MTGSSPSQLAVVKQPRPDPSVHLRRITTTLWCGCEHDKKDRQPCVYLNTKELDGPDAVPTYLVATEKLIAKIERDHGPSCIIAAETAQRKLNNLGAPNVFSLMMELETAPLGV